MTSLAAGSRREVVVELTRRLVQFNTVNPPGNEEPALRHLGQRLAESGLEIEYQQLDHKRVNLIARLAGTAPEGHLVFSGHIDVVHPGESNWAYDPFAAETTGDRLVGRGTADMKGGVASMAVAAMALADSGFRPRADLILAFSAGEEHGLLGARHMATTKALTGSAAIIVGEPTGLDVFIAEKGVLWLRVTARGQTAHGSMPHLGVNAIAFMARVISLLQANPFSFRPSAILGRPTVSVNVIEGGVKTNVVPDRCSIEVDMRTVPGQSAEEIVADIERMLRETASESNIAVRTQVEVIQQMPPVETPRGATLIEAVASAARRVRATEPEIGGVSYGTDAAALSPALGVPMVIFGPGDPGQAHQPNEYVDIDELDKATEAYVDIARNLLA